MNERMWYVYEKDFAGRWCQVVYHGDKPGKKMEGTPERSPIYEVPEDCIVNGEPQFGMLRARFAPPQEPKEE